MRLEQWLTHSKQRSANTLRSVPGPGYQRGAVLVEALIVISFLILGFLGMLYFQDLYTKQLAIARLSRAATVAYSMSACRGDGPNGWLGRDASNFEARVPEPDQEPAVAPDAKESRGAQNSESGPSGKLLQGPAGKGLLSGGKGILNPIANFELMAHAKAGSTTSTMGRRNGVFEGDVSTHSHISCGDPVREHQFEEVVGYVRDAMSGAW